MDISTRARHVLGDQLRLIRSRKASEEPTDPDIVSIE